MLSEQSLTIARHLIGASSIALRYADGPCTELKADHTMVTKADKAIESYITEELEDLPHGIRVVGEETFAGKSAGYLDEAFRNKAYIIDPIDGTAMYAHRIPVWGTILGYVEGGIIREGGCIIPGTGELLISSAGQTYYAQSGLPFPQWDLSSMLKVLEPPSDVFDETSLVALSQAMAHRGKLNTHNSVNAFCSTCYLAVLLATGRTAAAVHHAALWDYGGILVPLKNLGFISRPLSGQGNLLDLRIHGQNYNLDYTAKKALASTGGFIFARSEETARHLACHTVLEEKN